MSLKSVNHFSEQESEILNDYKKFAELVRVSPASGEPLRILVEIERKVLSLLGEGASNPEVDQFLIQREVPQIDNLLDEISAAAMAAIQLTDETVDEESFLDYLQSLNIFIERHEDVIVDTQLLRWKNGSNEVKESGRELMTNKMSLLIELLRDYEIYTDDLCVVVGENRKDMTRSGSFFCVEIPKLNKAVLIHPKYGEASIVLPEIIERSRVFKMNKGELEDELNGVLIPFYENDQAKWFDEMKLLLGLDSYVKEDQILIESFNLQQQLRTKIIAEFPSPLDLWKYPGTQKPKLLIGGLSLVKIGRIFNPENRKLCPQGNKSDLRVLLKSVYLGVDVDGEIDKTVPPENWKTRRQARIDIGISRDMLNRMIKEGGFEKDHPEYFGTFIDGIGKYRQYISDELCKELSQKAKFRGDSGLAITLEANTDFISHLSARKLYGLPSGERVMEDLVLLSSACPGSMIVRGKRKLFSKKLVEAYVKIRGLEFSIPEGWEKARSAKLSGYKSDISHVSKLRSAMDEWSKIKVEQGFVLGDNGSHICAFREVGLAGKGYRTYVSPVFQSFIYERNCLIEDEHDWVTRRQLIKVNPKKFNEIAAEIERIVQEVPTHSKLVKNFNDNYSKRYFSPEVLAKIKSLFERPKAEEGWLTAAEILRLIPKKHCTAQRIIKQLSAEYSDSIKSLVSRSNGQLLTHYGPDFVKRVLEELEKN